jgi:hypothetical protein
MLCFCSTTKAKSTVYVSFCLSWTMVKGLRPLGTILMCENKRFHPTKTIYTLITTQNIKVGQSILYFSSTTKTKFTVYVFFCLSFTIVRGLRPLETIRICENKRFHPTSLSRLTTTASKLGTQWGVSPQLPGLNPPYMFSFVCRGKWSEVCGRWGPF